MMRRLVVFVVGLAVSLAAIGAEAAGSDHDLAPVQFTGARTGRTINLGAFSRRRDKSLTSGTVMG